MDYRHLLIRIQRYLYTYMCIGNTHTLRQRAHRAPALKSFASNLVSTVARTVPFCWTDLLETRDKHIFFPRFRFVCASEYYFKTERFLHLYECLSMKYYGRLVSIVLLLYLIKRMCARIVWTKTCVIICENWKGNTLTEWNMSLKQMWITLNVCVRKIVYMFSVQRARGHHSFKKITKEMIQCVLRVCRPCAFVYIYNKLYDAIVRLLWWNCCVPLYVGVYNMC